MHYATLVCGHQAARELTSERKHFFFRQRSSSQLAVERGSLDVLHREKINTALAIEVVDGGNVGMIKLGERKGFLAKTLTCNLVGQRSSRQQLAQRRVRDVRLVRGKLRPFRPHRSA